MKKIISLIAGVVMASSLFAASAYAETVKATVSSESVKVGDTVKVVIDKLENTLTVDSFGISFNAAEFDLNEVYDVENYTVSSGEAIFQTSWYISSRKKGDLGYLFGDIEGMKKEGNVSFAGQVSAGEDALLGACDAFATIEFTALKEGTYELRLWEDSAGADQYSGTLATYSIVVNGNEPEPPVDNNNYGTAGNEFEGKATKYWTVDFAEWTGAADVSLTDGTTTKTINVTTADDSEYDIAGAVSFYVYVIGDAAAIENVYIVE